MEDLPDPGSPLKIITKRSTRANLCGLENNSVSFIWLTPTISSSLSWFVFDSVFEIMRKFPIFSSQNFDAWISHATYDKCYMIKPSSFLRRFVNFFTSLEPLSVLTKTYFEIFSFIHFVTYDMNSVNQEPVFWTQTSKSAKVTNSLYNSRFVTTSFDDVDSSYFDKNQSKTAFSSILL